MNILEFNDIDECIICFEEIPVNTIYVMIDNTGENAHFHLSCIEKWLNHSSNGILIQSPIKKLNIQMGENKICQMNLVVHSKDNTNECCCIL
jgi:hypothetical protein